jgi:hypothetical protein
MVADQRILELDSRRRRIAGAYKSQIATSAIAMSLGVVLLGGGGALLGLAIKDKSTISSNTDEIGKLDPTTGAATIDELQTENDKLTARRTKFLYGAYFGILVGIMAVAYSFVPLTKSIKSKRQLEGIALGPTRLQWNGGLGARLRF